LQKIEKKQAVFVHMVDIYMRFGTKSMELGKKACRSYDKK
jgi:hypothetical protein